MTGLWLHGLSNEIVNVLCSEILTVGVVCQIQLKSELNDDAGLVLGRIVEVPNAKVSIRNGTRTR